MKPIIIMSDCGHQTRDGKDVWVTSIEIELYTEYPVDLGSMKRGEYRELNDKANLLLAISKIGEQF